MSAPRNSWGGPSAAAQPTPARGAIEAIADGLSLALAFPLLFALPALVDAYLWFGIRISSAALADRADSLRQALDRAGLLTDLTPLAALFVPSLLAGAEPAAFYRAWDGRDLRPASWWLVCLIALGLVVLGAGLSALFRVPLAYVVRDQPLTLPALVGSVLRAWARLLALLGLIVGLSLFVSLPIVLAAVLFLFVGVNILPLLVVPALIGFIYLFFVLDAIVVSEVGPLRAIYLSVNVVRRNFWPVLGLIASILVISIGLPFVWLEFTDTPIGLLVGVLGNAFFATGLILASQQFYYDRLRRLTAPAPANPPARPGR